MRMGTGGRRFFVALAALIAVAGLAAVAADHVRAQDSDAYSRGDRYDNGDAYSPNREYNPDAPYRPSGVYREDENYRRSDEGAVVSPRPVPPQNDPGGYGEPYHAPGEYDGPPPERADDTYSEGEILRAGHSFFGSVSKGLASVIEHAFAKQGRPNGYILGEDAGGAFVAGLRYGEGTLYTKDAGVHKVFWQGPSVGYDFGGEGSKTMVLVYNLRDPSQIYHRFAGVQGSAYLVGGVGIQFQTYGNVTLAPIRAGIGLRLGANIGYLKYTRSPTWNPF